MSRSLTSLITGIILLCLTLYIHPCAAETYHVSTNNPSASDSNPGTAVLPWKTIQHAMDLLQPGDSAMIHNGEYNEQIYSVRSGDTNQGPIVLTAYPGDTPVIDGTGVTSGNIGILITHSYITLSKLAVSDWADNGIWLEGASHIEISDCEVYHCVFGIGISNGSHDFVLNRVTVHHFDLYGIDVSPNGADCYNGTFNDCVAHTGRDPQQNVDGFALGHGTQHSFVLNRCETYNVFDGFDISSRQSTLNRCSAHGCWNGGFKLWQDQVTLVNCVGYNCTSAIVELDWDGNPGRTRLINCTFMNGGLYTVWVENAGDTLEMTNCILAGGDNIGLAFEQMGVGNYHGDYNLFQNDNPARVVAVAYTDEFSVSQFDAWKTYSGRDGHSLITGQDTTIFVNPGGNDFHLKKTSPAIDNGTALGAPSEDFDGKPRPDLQAYDIGAYEYQDMTGLEDWDYPQEHNSLQQNFPNPFSTETTIRFTLPDPSRIRLAVYDLLGHRRAVLSDGIFPAGNHSVLFRNTSLPPGTYFYHLEFGGEREMRRFTIVR